MGFWDGFEFGACQVINLNGSACASHFLTVDVPIEELFFMSLSNIFSKTQYNPIVQNGGESLDYIQQKFGYLLDAVITLGLIVIIPEFIIFAKKHILI